MMIDELKKLFGVFISSLLLLLGLCIFSLAPILSQGSISVIVFNQLKEDFVPKEVELIVTNPLSGFIAQITIALLIALILTLPFFIYRLFKYLYPALYKKERRAINLLVFPSLVLFFLGCAFAYYFVVPSTFKLLYPLSGLLGATLLFSVGEFVQLVSSIMLATGVMFLLPVLMVLMSFSGLISQNFWFMHWRYALFIMLIFSAIITPDGTGVTMAMLLGPLVGLYVLGSVIARRCHRIT